MGTRVRSVGFYRREEDEDPVPQDCGDVERECARLADEVVPAVPEHSLPCADSL